MTFAAGSFCFFMPLRYGAAVLATLQFLLSGILAIALWIEVSKWSVDVGVRLTGTSAAAATYYTILSCSASIGSIAIFTRSKGVLRYFAFCLGWSLGIQLAVSALQLWGYLSTPTSQLLAACVQLPGMDQNQCNTDFALSVGWLITSIVVGLLIQLCSAYVVSSYSSKLSSEDEFTENAPIPGRPTISAPQFVGQTTVAPTFVNLDLGGNLVLDEKKWAASSRDSLDGSDDDEPRPDPGPPMPPMLDPAPPKRIPRVSPRYPNGMGPASTDAAVIAASTNPFTDKATPKEGTATDERAQVQNPFSDSVNPDAVKMV